MKSPLFNSLSIKILSLTFGVLFSLGIVQDTLSEIIPSDRKIDWSLAGARSDWTIRRTICATLLPSGGDDTPAIESAIASCPQGQVVKLSAGIFKIGSSIVWGNNSNVTLRGSGKGTTILQGQAGFSGNKFFDFYTDRGANPDWDWTLTPAIDLASGLSKGSTQINTVTSHGWSVGDYILIDQLNNGSGDPPEINYACGWCSRSNGTRLRAQMVKVTNVADADTVDISPPLFFTYNTSQSPQGKKANIKLEGISIESLTVDNRTSDASNMFYIYNLFNSLFYNLDLNGIPSGSQSRHFHLYNALWVTIKHCDIHGAEGNQTNQGYGIFFGYSTSGILVEDNTFYSVVLATAFEGATTGNVIGYNYTTGALWNNNNTNRLMIINHGGGSMNLIEGNIIEGRYREDSYFASGHWNTVVRNRIEQMSGKTDQLQVYDLEQGHHYNTAIGNVLGTVSRETVYQHENNDGAYADIKVIYRLGYTGPYDSGASGNDAQVKATMLRHGNWDSVNQTVLWDPGIADHNIPISYYMSSKPAFFGRCDWPWNGADLSPMTKTLPAKDRYESSSICVDSSVPNPPGNPR